RRHLLAQGFLGNKALHKQAVQYVCADTQAKALRFLESELTTEEAAVARRGRNAKSGHSPRSASIVAYRWSTGLEALMGYLFLENRLDRLETLMERIFQLVENGGINESGE
ncbi:MAG: ribonuclease III, partial [Clostridia bacterium]|nr:ribonuclease III [Clostridia bacterium]